MPVASFAAATSNPSESAGTQSVTVNLDKAAPPGGLTLSYGVGGTATQGSGNDFTIRNSGTVSVAAGARTGAIPVAILDDATQEGAETVVLTLRSGNGYTRGSTRIHTITIADNDEPAGTPGVTFSTGTLNLTEGGAAGSYTVKLQAKPTANVTVTATSGDAGAVKVHKSGGTPGATAPLTFTPTTWNQAQTVTVTPQSDGDADDENVTIAHSVSNVSGTKTPYFQRI